METSGERICFNSLRKHSSTRSVPVIAMTLFTQEHTVKSLTNIGFNGILSKPPDGKTVVELVNGILHSAIAKKR